MSKIKMILIVYWFVVGAIGSAGNNALYQSGVASIYGDACWIKEHEWRHSKRTMETFLFSIFGPLNFVLAYASTGGFSQGFSFHIGVPKRCGG